METPWCSVLLYNPRNCTRVLVLTSFINLRIFILFANRFSIIGAISDKPHSVHLELNGVFIDLGPACLCTFSKKSLIVIKLGWSCYCCFRIFICFFYLFLGIGYQSFLEVWWNLKRITDINAGYIDFTWRPSLWAEIDVPRMYKIKKSIYHHYFIILYHHYFIIPVLQTK